MEVAYFLTNKNLKTMIKRLIAGILFLPLFFIIFIIVSPICWVIKRKFSYPLDTFLEYYENL